jgi:phosphoribosylaminoimidazolecarboxamide formyltransferase/IMP cyclohydrolase
MPDLVPIRRAILSVSDKTDLIPFARGLASRGVEIISTGGTAKALAEAGVAATPIDQVTGFPEMMGGRVKTLHPMVHGGLLGLRDDPEHAAAMQRHGIRPIDLVCINLYPFEETIARAGIHDAEAIEQIDIGGPSMIRSAAKNFAWVTVVTASAMYDRVMGELNATGGATTLKTRAQLAATAFSRTSEYDAAIASYLSRTSGLAFPHVLRLGYIKADELRYGENPHQEASLYRDPASRGPTVVNARQLHGKQLSYNNINDAAAALELVKALARLDRSRVGAAVIKHTNPCGAALSAEGGSPKAGSLVAQAVDLAIAGDPVAAYGGILAVNATVDAPSAERMTRQDMFLEVVVAPEFSPEALEILRKRWTGVRLLAVGDKPPSASRKLEYRSVPGGMLVQDRDVVVPEPSKWRHAAGPAPSRAQLAAAAFLEAAVRFVSSNAVVIGGEVSPAAAGAAPGAVRLFGVGSGQVDRVTACRLAAAKAGPFARGAIAVGDAFFPFADGPEVLVEAGISLIVHPGGSKRDEDTFALCNAQRVTCMTTGVRHFKH